MLFFGFRLLDGSLLSLPLTTFKAALLAPNTGPCAWSPSPNSLVTRGKESVLLCLALSFSWLSRLEDVDAVLVGVSERYLCCEECLGEMMASESLVPADGGAITVARGLGF